MPGRRDSLEKVPDRGWDVLERSESYVLPSQPVHRADELGIQKSELPVSNMTVKDWAGVPTSTRPAQSRSLFRSVSVSA